MTGCLWITGDPLKKWHYCNKPCVIPTSERPHPFCHDHMKKAYQQHQYLKNTPTQKQRRKKLSPILAHAHSLKLAIYA